jgi:hypothetical protein
LHAANPATLNKHKEVLKNWQEPYHLGVGKNATNMGTGEGFAGF